MSATRDQSRRSSRTRRRPAIDAVSTALPTSSRPSVSEPGEKSAPTERMTTKADDQARTVIVTASSTLQSYGPSASGVAGLPSRVCSGRGMLTGPLSGAALTVATSLG